jgi:hypothetical protein
MWHAVRVHVKCVQHMPGRRVASHHARPCGAGLSQTMPCCFYSGHVTDNKRATFAARTTGPPLAPYYCMQALWLSPAAVVIRECDTLRVVPAHRVHGSRHKAFGCSPARLTVDAQQTHGEPLIKKGTQTVSLQQQINCSLLLSYKRLNRAVLHG